MRMRMSVLCAAIAAGFVFAPWARAEPMFSAPPPPKAPPAFSAQLNPTGSDALLYTPIAPCRAFYTTAAAVPAGQTRNFQVAGNGNFSSQGGPATGCGIPTHAKAVAVSFSAVTPAATGFFRAFATGAATPPTTVLNFRSGVNTTAGATVELGSGRMTVLVGGGAAKIVGDITGYYTRQISGMIAPDGSIYNGNSSIVSAVRNGAGSFTVTIDRDVTYCSPFVTGYSGYVYASAYAFSGNKIQVYVWYLNSAAVQTAYDTYFYLSVHC